MITRLYLMPTQNCNCSCTYCYIPDDERKKKGNDRILYSFANKFIKDLKISKLLNESPEIRFIGGEPYLNLPLMQKVIKSFLTDIPKGKIIINTNGTLINDNKINNLNSAHREKIYHIISLDGTEKYHNSRRKLKSKVGSFQHVIEGIKTLQSFNMSVYINMVLDSFSIKYLDSFMKYLINILSITSLSVSILYRPENLISPKEKFSLLKRAYRTAAKNKILLSGHHRLLVGNHISGLKCKAGKKTILISSYGRINPCQRFVGRIKPKKIEVSKFDFQKYQFPDIVESNCYDDNTSLSGKMIYDFYKKEYPEYLKVNEFDKILFGVI